MQRARGIVEARLAAERFRGPAPRTGEVLALTPRRARVFLADEAARAA
ncbi:MAG: hypothetical protein RJA99_5076 [Pseudomonadota bacterium]|jgi:hypothetical protein